MLHSHSSQKLLYFDNLLQQVSYGGYRSIAYGYKEIGAEEKERYLTESRDYFIKNINLLGLIVFENKLKSDASETIRLLERAGI